MSKLLFMFYKSDKRKCKNAVFINDSKIQDIKSNFLKKILHSCKIHFVACTDKSYFL